MIPLKDKIKNRQDDERQNSGRDESADNEAGKISDQVQLIWRIGSGVLAGANLALDDRSGNPSANDNATIDRVRGLLLDLPPAGYRQEPPVSRSWL
jgi:hypothetical protein